MRVEVPDVAQGSGLYKTVPLTEQLESGEITPDEYVRLRWRMIGRTTVLETIVSPLLEPVVLLLNHILAIFIRHQNLKRPKSR